MNTMGYREEVPNVLLAQMLDGQRFMAPIS